MECSVCGSQSTTFKQGISKSGKNAGKPWKAYDCNEPQCKNEKGYPNRTFAPTPRGSSPQTAQAPLGDLKNIMSKLDEILLRLPEKQRTLVQQAEEEETSESPF